MVFGGKISKITNNEIKHYSDCFKKVLCSPETSLCYMRTCSKCPGITSLSTYLTDAIQHFRHNDEREIENIYFKQEFVKSPSEFIEYFVLKLEKLITHAFITQQQSNYIKNVKTSLAAGEFLISCDFAENYTFVLQSEAQGYHWNNKQATIHPFVLYYKNEQNILDHFSFVVISECLIHNLVLQFIFL